MYRTMQYFDSYDVYTKEYILYSYKKYETGVVRQNFAQEARDKFERPVTKRKP